MSPETKEVVISVLQWALSRGLSGQFAELAADAVIELESEPQSVAALAPGAIVVSKTRTDEAGNETTTHYLCGDQRATRKEALADLEAWGRLKGDRDAITNVSLAEMADEEGAP